MTKYNQWDIILVEVIFSDMTGTKKRSALIISNMISKKLWRLSNIDLKNAEMNLEKILRFKKADIQNR